MRTRDMEHAAEKVLDAALDAECIAAYGRHDVQMLRALLRDSGTRRALLDALNAALLADLSGGES